MAVLDFNKTNENNYRNRGDYGVRVARPGFDAENCAQNQLLFNSNWPILQICKVIDLGKTSAFSHKYFDVSNNKWINSLPSGLNSGGETSIGSVSVSKNYLFYTSTAKRYYDSSYNTYFDFYYKMYKHGLGYVPFYFKSDEVSNIANRVILTSVDIAKDVDYPYTEGALPMISSTKDYGLSSASIFGKRVPGLSSGMFSKLVQAVKTTKTSRWTVSGGGTSEKILCWSPFSSASEAKAGVVNKYEAFSFSAYKSPFLDSALGPGWINATGSNTDTDLFGYGPYWSRDRVVRMLALSESGSLYNSAMAYSNIGQDTLGYTDASLVILRSPMVSPEYTEITI